MFIINEFETLEQNTNHVIFSITRFTNSTIERTCSDNETLYGISNLVQGQVDDILVKNGTFGFVSKSQVLVTGSGALIHSNIKHDFTRVAQASSNSPGILKYIDKCSNQELISPSVIYNPTIQYLYFPENTEQTPHVHSSFRIGLILHGNGIAVHENGEIELTENKVFMLPANERHFFKTVNSEMSLMVFHPDSDIGPTDDFNNMIVRTLINHA